MDAPWDAARELPRPIEDYLLRDILGLAGGELAALGAAERRRALGYCWVRFNLQRTSFPGREGEGGGGGRGARAIEAEGFEKWRRLEERLRAGRLSKGDKRKLVEEHMRRKRRRDDGCSARGT